LISTISLKFFIKDHVVFSGAGYISWKVIQDIYKEDAILKGNMHKAPKLTYEALHLGHNNKMSIQPLHFLTTQQLQHSRIIFQAEMMLLVLCL